ncbi:MAG: Fe-S cluster assembly ATPase SufC [Patescibacteria group bacterium]
MNLELKSISVSVSDTPVVSGASLSVSSGDVALIMGPNGSGKSSLLSAIMGHPRFTVTGGSASLDGKDITALSVSEKARRGIFFSLQNLPAISGVSLSKLIVESVRAFGREIPSPLAFRGEVAARAKEFGFPEELLSRTVNEKLSGGEKKQMEMIQLFALRPKCAILDEIDSGVDVDVQKKIARAIAALRAEGTGFLIVSHHVGFAKMLLPNKTYLMKGGAVVREGDAKLIDEIAEKGFEK